MFLGPITAARVWRGIGWEKLNPVDVDPDAEAAVARPATARRDGSQDSACGAIMPPLTADELSRTVETMDLDSVGWSNARRMASCEGCENRFAGDGPWLEPIVAS